MKPITIYSSLHFLTKLNSKYKIYSYLSIFTLLFFLVIMLPSSSIAQSTLNKIVIDAGHGGKDPGASGKYSREKDVVLAIALKTGELIKKRYPSVEIIYTRKTDVFIPLKERAEIANREKASLFISIHCNSNKSSQPHGSETYVMGLHKSEANLNVAQKENAAILFEDDYKQQYDGFDPTSDESHIIFNFFQNSFLSQNLDFATTIQTKFTQQTTLKDRGVKQAGFWVLYKTTMPGVLIETGFLSNVSDEKLLNSKAGQAKISKAISDAVADYKENHDAREKNKLAHKKNHEPLVNKTSDEVKAKKQYAKTEKNNNSKSTIIINKKDANKNIKEKKPIYKIQFLSLSEQKTLKGNKFKKLSKVSSYKYKGLYRYTSGETQDYDTAIKLQNQVRKVGFKDAFIIAFWEGKRISLSEAKKMK